MRFSATNNHETLKWDKPKLLGKFLEKNLGDVIVDIEKKKSTLSDEQRAYYFVAIIKATQQNESTKGNSREYWHRYCKARFLPIAAEIVLYDDFDAFNDEEIQKIGTILSIARDNKLVSTAIMEKYMKLCRDFLWEDFEINVPLPGEAPLEIRYNPPKDS